MLKKHQKKVSPLIFLFFVGTAAFSTFQATANEAIEVLKASIKQFEQTDINLWSYTLNTYETDGGVPFTTKEQFNPKLATKDQWQLIKRNKKEPTAKQKLAYQQSKIERIEKENGNSSADNMGINLSELIALDTLVLTSTDENTYTYSFKPQMDDMGEDTADNFDGIIRFDRKAQYIKQIEIKNNKSFSPELVATIKSFNLIYDFIKINNTVLPSELKTKVKGSLGFFIKFDEESFERFEDYQYTGE